LMMATAFMGYVLPWGQMSYWGAQVITGFFSAFPLVGEPIRVWLLGGYAPDQAALTRFFSLHYLLPFVIAAVVILHIWALHIPGSGNPTGVDVKDEKDTLPFHPFYTAKDGWAAAAFLTLFAVLTMLPLFYPFIEARLRKDRQSHHLLQRPRDVPARTALGAMAIGFYVVLLISGGNDVVAQKLDISLNAMTWAGRIGLVVLPPIVYFFTYRFCIGLERHDREVLEHGIETGVIRRLPHGEFIEVHQPLGPIDEHGHFQGQARRIEHLDPAQQAGQALLEPSLLSLQQARAVARQFRREVPHRLQPLAELARQAFALDRSHLVQARQGGADGLRERDAQRLGIGAAGGGQQIGKASEQ